MLAGLNAVSVVAHDIGPDVAELFNESINVVCGNLGNVIPSHEEMMVREGFGGRIGQLSNFIGREILKNTCGILT